MDLLAVIAVLVLLFLLLTPALARTRVMDQGFQCRNNLRQMMLAWKAYCADNTEKVPSAWQSAGDWWPGLDMTWSGIPTNDVKNPGNWNVEVTAKLSALWPYCGNNAAIFMCPADGIFPCVTNGQSYPRVRSMTMLSWFNSMDAAYFGPPGYVVYRKTTDVLKPGPAMTMVFLHERADSINDGEFITSMTGWDPYQPTSWQIVDIPANHHDGGCGIAFADGHSEIHKWQDRVLNFPLGSPLNIPSPNSMDAYWLMQHSTRMP